MAGFEGSKAGDELEAFVYFDSEDRPIATTIKPKVLVNEFAFLLCKDVNTFGAFLDWGLDKDLLVPYREQKARMQTGKKYIVYAYADEQSGRIAATVKVEKHISSEEISYEVAMKLISLFGPKPNWVSKPSSTISIRE